VPRTRPARPLAEADYRRLLALRTGLRRFLLWSEEQAASSGVTPSQHQLLLAIRGYPGEGPPTIGDVAASLLLRHHSAVELVNRTEEAGLVRRTRDTEDHRVVRLSPTPRGARVLEDLSERHVEELARLAGSIGPLLAGLDEPVPEAARSTA
jgi:DNA-binding MarR family transcriptional regulator